MKHHTLMKNKFAYGVKAVLQTFLPLILTCSVCFVSNGAALPDPGDTTGLQLMESRVEARRRLSSTGTESFELPMSIVSKTPSLLGEADVLKTFQLLPGVTAGNDGLSGIYVRGGGPDENLLLLDGVPIYNAEHMLGLFSIFQPEAVRSAALFKASFPARFGGRTSSIMDIRAKDGDCEETHGCIGLSLISGKLHLEGPLRKGRMSYSLSARGMHTALTDRIIRKAGSPANYFFYDLNAKISYKVYGSDLVSLNVYNGKDVFYYDGTEVEEGVTERSSHTSIDWGNTMLSLKWKHDFNEALHSDCTIAFTDYAMDIGYNDRENGSEGGVMYSSGCNSGIRDFTGKADFSFRHSPTHHLRFGGLFVHHIYRPETFGSFERLSADEGYAAAEAPAKASTETGEETAIFIEDEIRVSERLGVNAGLRLVLFLTGGSVRFSPEPRLSIRYGPGNGAALTAAYSRMSQHVHLLSSARLTLPTDLWVPVTKNIRPMFSDQYSSGISFPGLSGWEFSLEGYWKRQRNVLELKEGQSVFTGSGSWERNVGMGIGRSYGLELLARKTLGRTRGWLAYTLAKSERRFPDGSISGGEWFPYRYDRRHNISVVASHRLGERLELGGTWTFATGTAYSVPEREICFQRPDGSFVQAGYSSRRNNLRLPPSHCLNLSLDYRKVGRRGESIWNFSIYNAYNRMNPNLVFGDFEYSPTKDSYVTSRKDRLKSLTILPLIPSFGYTFRF